MRPPLPLLLKLCTAAASGGAALLSARRLLRDAALAALRRAVRDAAAALPCRAPAAGGAAAAASAATVLVAGFPGHGKSSLINTACRALAAEEGPLLLRAEAAPPGSPGAGAGAAARRAVWSTVAAEEEEEEEEEVAVEMVEAAALPEPRRMTRADAEAAIEECGVGAGAECVVVVLRCGGPCKEREAAVRKLPEIAAAVRDRGLHLVVVLTHKKALKTKWEAEDLRREVAFRAKTDCVFFIENYTLSSASNLRHPAAIANDFDTHFTILAIVRQCLEFVKLRRGRSAAAARRGKPSPPARTASHVRVGGANE